MVSKSLFKACKQRCIRNFGKPAEIPKLFAKIQKEYKQGIRRDREDFLQDESRKEACKRIISFSSEMLIKGIIKGLRNKKGNIKMQLQKLKKEGTSSINMSLQSEKVSLSDS